MRLGSGVVAAVVEAGSCSSNLTPSLETSTCHRCGHKKPKEKKKKEEREKDLSGVHRQNGLDKENTDITVCVTWGPPFLTSH